MNELKEQEKKVNELQKQLDTEKQKLKELQINILPYKTGDYVLINNYVIMFINNIEKQRIFGYTYDNDGTFEEYDSFYIDGDAISTLTKEEAKQKIAMWHNKHLKLMGFEE